VSLSVQYLSDFSALYPHPILEAYTQLFSHYFNTVRVKCLVDLRTLIIYNTEIVFVCAGVLRHLLILLLSFYGYDEQARLARVIRSLYESLESHIESSYYTLRTKYQYNYSLRRKHKTSNGALIYIEMFEALGLHISRQQPIGSRNSVSILRYTRRYLSQLSYVRRFDIACTVSSTVDVLTEMINETMIARQKGCHKHRKKFKVKVKAEAKAKVDSITRFWNRIHKYVFHGNR
jgi:hypothetical protein